MDPLFMLAMVLREFLPVAVVVGIGVVLLKSRNGGSLLSRLVGTPIDQKELQQLQMHMEEMRQDLEEMHERLDFTERALMQPSRPLPQVEDLTPQQSTPV